MREETFLKDTAARRQVIAGLNHVSYPAENRK
jgi:hypothetical protein